MKKPCGHICFVLLMFFCVQFSFAQTKIDFREGSFYVSIKATTTDATTSEGRDFTAKELATLEFFDVPSPKVTVSIYNLKWKLGVMKHKLFIKNAWVMHSSNIVKQQSIDREIATDKEMALIEFEINGDGREEISVQFGVKSPNQKNKKVKPRKGLIFKKNFNSIGVNKSKKVKENIKEELKPNNDEQATASINTKVINETKSPNKNNSSSSSSINQSNRERDAWRLAQQANSREAMESFLQQYPNGQNATLAKRFLSSLNQDASNVDVDQTSTGTAPTQKLDTLQSATTVDDNWKKAQTLNTFDSYFNFVKGFPNHPFYSVGLDSIKSKPILWEKKEQKEGENGTYVFVVKFEDVYSLKFKEDKKPKNVEINQLDSNNLQFIILDGESHQCEFSDEFGREAIVVLNPKYQMLNAILDDSEEQISYKIMGGQPPYYISFLKKGFDVPHCRQRIEKDGVIVKEEWCDNCDLDGVYRIEIRDAAKNDVKRFNDIEFIDNSLDLLKYMWIVFIPILLVLVWFVMKRV